MNTYRIRTFDGLEIAAVQAASWMEAIATPAACAAPLRAEITCEGGAMLACRELWLGEYPGWSLVATRNGAQAGLSCIHLRSPERP